MSKAEPDDGFFEQIGNLTQALEDGRSAPTPAAYDDALSRAGDAADKLREMNNGGG